MMISMRQRVLFTLLMVFGIVFSSVTVFAQSILLPEKNVVDPVNNGSSPTSEGVSGGDSKKADSEIGNWISVIVGLMLVSLLLLFLEIAIIPGFGVAGISGGILLAASLFLSYWKLSTTMAVIATAVAIFGVFLLIMFMLFVFPNTRLGKKFVLEETAPVGDELFAVSNTNRFLGAEGVAVSHLRPSGIAKIADERVDVITEGGFVEQGTKIKVVKTTAGRVIVASLED